MKKLLCAALALAMLCSAGCSDKEQSSSQEAQTTLAQDSEPRYLTLIYDKETVDEGYALVAEKYFNAIINNDVSAYKECLFPYYAEKWDEYLQSEYNYGIETSFEGMKKNLTIDGGRYTTLTVSYAQEHDMDVYLERLVTLMGESFPADCKERFDESHSLLFTINARYDGYDEDFSAVSDKELICVKSGGKYYVFG